ncbi:hypothetical protein Slin15195_G040610 [Septoria linicola]|uniref:Uncharacterized protein n=1 Tax=Septoria linicola TaxID=215465 RepID=A0A9Q9ARI6_9PEZI|nr:hypothetical protein Slin14017_G044140 [Septoria linicola]USW50742.1 hypothetical protein Slin15195_G040610 [Septoria linicola]
MGIQKNDTVSPEHDLLANLEYLKNPPKRVQDRIDKMNRVPSDQVHSLTKELEHRDGELQRLAADHKKCEQESSSMFFEAKSLTAECEVLKKEKEDLEKMLLKVRRSVIFVQARCLFERLSEDHPVYNKDDEPVASASSTAHWKRWVTDMISTHDKKLTKRQKKNHPFHALLSGEPVFRSATELRDWMSTLYGSSSDAVHNIDISDFQIDEETVPNRWERELLLAMVPENFNGGKVNITQEKNRYMR